MFRGRKAPWTRHEDGWSCTCYFLGLSRDLSELNITSFFLLCILRLHQHLEIRSSTLRLGVISDTARWVASGAMLLFTTLQMCQMSVVFVRGQVSCSWALFYTGY